MAFYMKATMWVEGHAQQLAADRPPRLIAFGFVVAMLAIDFSEGRLSTFYRHSD